MPGPKRCTYEDLLRLRQGACTYEDLLRLRQGAGALATTLQTPARRPIGALAALVAGTCSPVYGVLTLALFSLSTCADHQGAADAPRAPPAEHRASDRDDQPPYPGEPNGATVPESCAAQTSSGVCFPTEEAACRSLGCPHDRCSIGYSLPPMIGCAGRDEEGWVPE